MQYGPGMFSELSIRNGMKEWIESRCGVCSDPRIYDELPHEVKDELDTWIAAHIAPSKDARPCYKLKTAFHRNTGIYIYTGVFKGAILKAGYKPVNPKDRTEWRFRVNVCKNGVG